MRQRTCDSSDRLFIHCGTGSKASIFVRKTLQVRPRDQKRECVFIAHRVGPAFFDEDDACAGLWTFVIACLNCCACRIISQKLCLARRSFLQRMLRCPCLQCELRYPDMNRCMSGEIICILGQNQKNDWFYSVPDSKI